MERLTYKNAKGEWCVKNNPKCAIATCSNDEGRYYIGEPIDRLAELEDELENGTLLKAPCKVGDEMWILNDPYFVGDIFAMKVEAIEIRSDEVYLCGYHKEASEYFESRTSFAFKTREEAGKGLEELKNAEREEI